jgi:hypothetical protein
MIRMTPEEGPQSRADEKAGWSTPLPEKNPPSTYAPVFLALGITFLLFGVVSSYVFSAAGLILMAASISKWVGEFLHGE